MMEMEIEKETVMWSSTEMVYVCYRLLSSGMTMRGQPSPLLNDSRRHHLRASLSLTNVTLMRMASSIGLAPMPGM